MKVMFINTSIYSGSTGKIIEEICKNSINNNIEYSIIYNRGDRKKSQITSSYKITNIIEVFTEFIGTRIFDAHGLSSFYSTIKTIRIIKVEKPDVIHIHNLHGYYINYKLLFNFINSTDIKIVWTLHDCWSYTGHCSHYMDSKCNRWKKFCHNCPEKNYYPGSIFLDKSKRNYFLKKQIFSSNRNLTLVPITQWMERDLKHSFFKRNNINKHINNGININLYNPNPKLNKTLLSIAPPNSYFIGVANKWDEKKGLYDFLKLSNLIQYKIVLVGKLKIDISNFKNIIHIERTDDTIELCGIYTNAKALINLSHQETFPTIILESLACNTPVISYSIGGSSEIIKNGINGFLVPQNLNAVVEAINKLDKIDRSNLRQEVIESYNSEKNFISYHKLYNKLVFEKS